ncbi:uncharacterized protein YjbI with pentapeptide repeats [Oxalobacteraceae bacterium GrIS 2.11]
MMPISARFQWSPMQKKIDEQLIQSPVNLPADVLHIVTDYARDDAHEYAKNPLVANEKGEFDRDHVENRVIALGIQQILSSPDRFTSADRRAIFETLQDKSEKYRWFFSNLLFRMSFHHTLDVSHTDLSHLDLTGMNFGRLVATGANFTGSNLTGSFMQRAILNHAILTGTIMCRINMEYADLTHAHLEDTVFAYTKLAEVDTTNARFIRVKFIEAAVRAMIAPRALTRIARELEQAEPYDDPLGLPKISASGEFSHQPTANTVSINASLLPRK